MNLFPFPTFSLFYFEHDVVILFFVNNLTRRKGTEGMKSGDRCSPKRKVRSLADLSFTDKEAQTHVNLKVKNLANNVKGVKSRVDQSLQDFIQLQSF